MKKHYSQCGSQLCISNLPVKVNDQESEEIEVTEEENAKIESGNFDFTVEKGKLKFTERVKPIDEKAVAREGLKAKLEAGTATETDIKEALKLLL